MRCFILSLAILFAIPALAEGPRRSPIRDICQGPAPVLSRVRTIEDLRNACNLLQESGATSVVELSRDVLAVLDQMDNSETPEAKVLARETGRLADALNDAATASDVPTTQLGQDLRNLAATFSTTQARRQNSTSYYESMKAIIAQTSQGQRLIDCFEKNQAPNVGGFAIEFIGDGNRTPGNDQGAYLAYPEIPGDPQNRSKLVMSIDVRTNPIAAVSMVAHEMQHACLGGPVCEGARSCDQDEATCQDYYELTVMDELTGHKLEAEIFAEFAEASPGLMCSYVYVDTVNGAQQLAEFHAQNEEAYYSGALLRQLNRRYIGAGLWNSGDAYDPISTTPGPRQTLLRKLEAAGIPPQN